MVDNFKENIGEHSLAKESAEEKFNPRNRSSILHGQARHLEEILFNSNFDYETKVSIRGQGNSRHNNSIKNISQDSSSQDDEFRAIRGILLNISECESKKSLDTFTDSASDCSTMGDVALDEIQSQMPSRWFEFDENGLYYDSDPGELKILRQQHEDIFEEAPCEEALLGTGCETFKSFGMEISGQKFEGGVHLLSKGNFSDEESSYDAMMDVKDDGLIGKAFEVSFPVGVENHYKIVRLVSKTALKVSLSFPICKNR